MFTGTSCKGFALNLQTQKLQKSLYYQRFFLKVAVRNFLDLLNIARFVQELKSENLLKNIRSNNYA